MLFYLESSTICEPVSPSSRRDRWKRARSASEVPSVSSSAALALRRPRQFALGVGGAPGGDQDLHTQRRQMPGKDSVAVCGLFRAFERGQRGVGVPTQIGVVGGFQIGRDLDAVGVQHARARHLDRAGGQGGCLSRRERAGRKPGEGRIRCLPAQCGRRIGAGLGRGWTGHNSQCGDGENNSCGGPETHLRLAGFRIGQCRASPGGREVARGPGCVPCWAHYGHERNTRLGR